MEKTENFEDKLKKINENIKILEDNNLPLDEAIKVYEKSQKIIKQATKILEEADGKVRKIIDEIDTYKVEEFEEK